MYDIHEIGTNGVRIATRDTGKLAGFVRGAVNDFYSQSRFYKVGVSVKAPALDGLEQKALGELQPFELTAEPEGGNPKNMGKIGVNLFVGGKKRAKQGVDYAASDTFGSEEIATYYALTLWLNTFSPFSTVRIRGTQREEDALRRSLERDAFLEYLRSKDV